MCGQMAVVDMSLKLEVIVPAIYKNIVNKKILMLDVTETKATCDNCTRARDKRFSYTYKENLKCCTFHPYTPNFAVGALLSTPVETVGIKKLKSKIENREFAFPIGVMAPFDYQYLFLTKEENQFGNDENLLCPYYDKIKNIDRKSVV